MDQILHVPNLKFISKNIGHKRFIISFLLSKRVKLLYVTVHISDDKTPTTEPNTVFLVSTFIYCTYILATITKNHYHIPTQYLPLHRATHTICLYTPAMLE